MKSLQSKICFAQGSRQEMRLSTELKLDVGTVRGHGKKEKKSVHHVANWHENNNISSCGRSHGLDGRKSKGRKELANERISG